MTSLLVLSAADVSFLTKQLTASKLCTMIGRTMHAISADLKESRTRVLGPGEVAPIQNPLRIALDSPSYKTLIMPSRLTTSQKVAMNATKMVAVPKAGNPIPGLPGTTLLFDEVTGACKAVVNSGELTGLRTAAASCLATKLLAKADAKNLVVFGTGLILESFPSLRSITLIARNATSSRADLLRQKLKIKFTEVTVELVSGGDLEESREWVRRADIICTCVPSTEPVFKAEDLKVGVHINAIGSYTPSMQEFPSSLITPPSSSSASSASSRYISKILVDSKSACLAEAGEIIRAKATEENLVELGDIVTIDGEGRGDLKEFNLRREGRSLFKCVGIGGMDVAVTLLVYEMAVKMNVGTLVPY